VKLKSKILSLMCAGVLTVIPFDAFNASAAIGDHDPNGDGQLTISDSTFILQFLLGRYNPTDLWELDVDDNCVVSVVDSNKVQAYDSNMSSVSSFNYPDGINSMNSTSTSRNYRVYNAQNGSYKRNYNLSVEDFDNSDNTNMIIGTNDMIEDWSNRGTAKIVGNGFLATGFVVDSHTIATAAHVVFDTDSNIPKSLTSILLFDQNETPHPFTPKEYHIPTAFKNLSEYSETYDYALITVEQDLSDYMSYNLGAITDYAATNQLTVGISGFPGGYNSYSTHTEMLSLGSIVLSTDLNFKHNADTQHGSSGSPVYISESYNGINYHTVIGIHVRNYEEENEDLNGGVRFGAHELKFYRANNNLQY